MLKVNLQYFWPPDATDWLTGKDPDAGKDWRWEEKGTTEDEMVGWLHQCNGHEFEQTLGDGEGQGSLVCCSPRCHKESDMTEWLNTTTTLAWGEQRLGKPERTVAEELVGYAVLEKVTHSCCWKGLLEFRTFLFYFLALGHAMACGILVPWSRIELMSRAVEAWGPNHWTARKVPEHFTLKAGLILRSMDRKADGQRGEVTCPRARRKPATEQRTATSFPGGLASPCMSSGGCLLGSPSYTPPPLLAFSERVFWSQREQWRLSTGRKIWWRPSEDSTPFPRSSWNSSVSGSETYHLSEVMKGLSPLMAGGFYQVKNSEDKPKLSSNTCEMFQTFPHSPSSPLTWKNIHSASVSVISQHTQNRIVEVFQASEKHLNFGSKITL